MKLWRSSGWFHRDSLIKAAVRSVLSWQHLCLLLRNTCHRDIINLQVEMIRQFYIQLVKISALPHQMGCFSSQVTPLNVVLIFQNDIHGLIERYSVNESLMEEIERLKEENRRLKTNYWAGIQSWFPSLGTEADWRGHLCRSSVLFVCLELAAPRGVEHISCVCVCMCVWVCERVREVVFGSLEKSWLHFLTCKQPHVDFWRKHLMFKIKINNQFKTQNNYFKVKIVKICVKIGLFGNLKEQNSFIYGIMVIQEPQKATWNQQLKTDQQQFLHLWTKTQQSTL